MAASPARSPLASGLSRPRNLLIGRDVERSAIRAMLAAPDTAVLTLTGPGGAGKTRLSLEVLDGMPQDITGEVAAVALAPLTSNLCVPLQTRWRCPCPKQIEPVT